MQDLFILKNIYFIFKNKIIYHSEFETDCKYRVFRVNTVLSCTATSIQLLHFYSQITIKGFNDTYIRENI